MNTRGLMREEPIFATEVQFYGEPVRVCSMNEKVQMGVLVCVHVHVHAIAWLRVCVHVRGCACKHIVVSRLSPPPACKTYSLCARLCSLP